MTDINPEREKLTQDEYEFHQTYKEKGIQIIPPAYVFKNMSYDYSKRAEKLKTLPPELLLLVVAANKQNMCIKASDFIFAPPQTKDELQKEIINTISAIVKKVDEES